MNPLLDQDAGPHNSWLIAARYEAEAWRFG